MSQLGSLQFADPWWLLATLLGPALVAAAWLRERRLKGLAFPGLSDRPRGYSGWRVMLRHLPVLLAACGVMAAAVALARPQRGSVRENTTTEGVDIVVALDISGSMAAEDFQPRNRVAVAKAVVADFVRRRPNDRIGLVIFAAKALSKVPPTTDTAMLLRQLDDVQLDMLPDGTAIGSALATSLARLRRSTAKSKIIVLVTDGVNNTGEIDPATATDIARAMEVRIYTIGVGRGGLVPIPVRVRDPYSGAVVTRRVTTEVTIDEALLKRIAARTNGEFFRATDSASLRMIFDRVDALEKSEIKLHTYRRYRDLHLPWMIAAAALLAAGGLVWVTGLRVAPA
jgi:Ca-activated chloride channel homolog